MVTKAKFKFLGGDLCLDLLDTAGGRVRSGGRRDFADRVLDDKLAGQEDLVRWGETEGVLSRRAKREAAAAEAVFECALALRASLCRLAKACVENRRPPAEDLDVLNRELAAAYAHRAGAHEE